MQEEPAERKRQGRHPGRPSVLTPFPTPARPQKAPSRGSHHNVPAQPTRLIGREPEVAAVREQLLRPDVRLLTLTGAGGSGKTRLALEVAAGLVERFADGVFLIDLAPSRDSAVVVSAIARPLGVRDIGGRPLFETLKEHLRSRRVLLVLDNFEHVLPAAIQLAELLAACPELKMLATSRAPLRVRWEHEFVLPPLPVPDLRQLPTPGVLAHNPAVGLFVQRAQAVRVDFCLTAETAQPVAEICVRLDGLPLALELAAARVKALAPAALLERLQHRFEIMVGGPQDQPARHKTLRAAIDWSYDLLDEAERMLFRRLAVFAGGWTLEAAEVVCRGEGPGVGAVLHGLTRLVDQSLVVAEEGSGREFRYHFLETIREYAQARLEQHAEAADMRHQHAAYFVAMAERASARLHGREQVPWLEWLEREHDNLRAALGWSLAKDGRAEMGLRLAAALWEFWSIRGYLSEGQSWLEKAYDRGMEAEPGVRAQALNGLGTFAWMRGEYGRSVPLLQESVGLSKEAGDLAGEGRVLCQLSWAESDQNRALALLDEALDLVCEAGDQWGESYVRFFRGGWLTLYGQGESAVPWLEASAGLYHELEDDRGLAYTLVCLGEVMQSRCASPRAAELLREAVALFAPLRDLWGLLVCLVRLASVAISTGDFARTATLLGAAEGVQRRTGSELMPPDQAQHDRDAAATRVALGEVAFEAAWAEGRAMSLEQTVGYALQTEESLAPTCGAGDRSAGRGLDRLTPREREVAELVAHGLTNRQIAEHLVVSERTVDSHVEHIRDKLRVRSRAQIAAWAVTHGLAPTGSV